MSGRGRGGPSSRSRKRTNSAESGSRSSRPSSGGGVKKRSSHDDSNPTSTGKYMTGKHRKAMSNPNQPYSRTSNGSAFGPSKRRETNVVEISNLINRNEQEILQSLAKNAEFTPVETLWVGNKLLITCATSKEAWNIKSKTDNMLFNGQKIVVHYVYNPSDVGGSSPGGKESDLIIKLKQIIQSKYDPVHFYLDLENFTSAGFSQDPSKTSFGKVLCKLIGELCPDVQSISFASNGISSLSFFSDLYRHVPRLANLSFKDNKLRNYDDLKGLNGKRFPALRELILDGNQVKSKEIEKTGSMINFKSNVKNLFPSLKLLDGEPLLEEIKFGVEAESSEIPFPVKEGFFDSQNTQSVVQGFLLMYYELFDSNRSALASFYEDNSTFSLSIAKNHKKDGPSSDLLFKNWLPFNRSLDRITQADKRFKLLHIGSQAITNILLSLPLTKHPLQEPPEKKKFIFDAFQQGVEPNVCLYIFLHGEMGVNDGSSKRSFDRTFVLIPASPGSRAAAAGFPVSIINDILSLRPFSDNYAWKNIGSNVQTPSASPTATATLTSNLPSDPNTLEHLRVSHGLQEAQHAQVIQFARVTGLNYMFSLQCLAESQWSNEHALQAFNNAKPQIPLEAFRQ